MYEKPIELVIGGTVKTENYIRRADVEHQLLSACQNKEFAYVLACRQIGKSSLAIEIERQLKLLDIRVVYIELNEIGTASTDAEWYFSLLKLITKELKLKLNLEDWWDSRTKSTPVKNFLDFLREVVLVEINEPIVIFVDEIDATLTLSFKTDDFFGAIRSLHNERVRHPAYERLTFVLFGTATPDELIRDYRRTPFNIGHAIPIRDFTRLECAPLQQVIEANCPGEGETYFNQIYEWTNGHPFLTQKLCKHITEVSVTGTETVSVDELVDQIFIKPDTAETNIDFVESRLLNDPRKSDMLRLYRRVLEGKTVSDDKKSIPINRLKLYGLVVVQESHLKPRNKIYTEYFDLAWIKKNTPANWTRRLAYLSPVLAILLCCTMCISYITIQENQRQAQIQTNVDAFQNNPSADIRANSIVELSGLRQTEKGRELFLGLPLSEQASVLVSLQRLGHNELAKDMLAQHKIEEQSRLLVESYQLGSLALVQESFNQFNLTEQTIVLAALLERFDEPNVRALFFDLPLQNQVAMFEQVDSSITNDQLFIIGQSLYRYLDNNPGSFHLLQTMAKSLRQSGTSNTDLVSGIEFWLQGRDYAAIDEPDEAITAYMSAIEHTPQNFGAYFDLALVQIDQKQYLDANLNLEKVKEIVRQAKSPTITNTISLTIPINSVQRFVDAKQIEQQVDEYLKQIDK